METAVTTGQKHAVTLEDFISYANAGLCQDLPKLLFPFNKDSVLSVCVTPCSGWTPLSSSVMSS